MAFDRCWHGLSTPLPAWLALYRVAMRPAMISLTCPACGLVLAVDTQHGTAELVFDMKAWRASCVQQAASDPALCAALQPLLLELIAEPKTKPNGPHN